MSNLNDKAILKEVSERKLLTDFDPRGIGPASYELRAGNIYYDLDEGTARLDAEKYGNQILIKPGHRVVIITAEEVNLPSDMIGRVFLKGTLFSIGLTPVSTVVDPGFSGNLGIVTHNISQKYIKLSVYDRIAKIEFTRLEEGAGKPYSGQHGYKTSIWPVRHDLTFDYASVQRDPRVRDEVTEGRHQLPRGVANELSRIQSRQNIVDFSLLGSFLVQSSVLIAAFNEYVPILVSIAINIASTALVGAFLYLFQRRRPK